ncbi:hypothetical protein Tco_0678237 [Tanacetum coccineum]|uniref:Uncharacterized protein n=1 Tax=Tanacetum coccineum TaxID=301880 RepID=A0ABQ4XEJ7_9ASTR
MVSVWEIQVVAVVGLWEHIPIVGLMVIENKRCGERCNKNVKIDMVNREVEDRDCGVSNPTEYGVSNSLSNTAYSSQLINMAYPLPLDTAYRSSGTETKIIDFRAKKNFFLRANPADIFTLVTGRTCQS